MNKSTFTGTTMETIQWFVFLLASSVALPIVIGAIYHMNFTEVSGLMQRSFFVIGTASLLQALFGHKLPIAEGPAGIWVSVFTVMAVTGLQNGTSLHDTLRSLETIMLLAGLFLFLLGFFKIAQKILPIFTPLVTGTFFLLLTVQLSGTFLKGMLGLQGNSNTIQLIEAILAFITFFMILGLSTFAKGWLSNYAVFIGIVIGWICYVIFVGTQTHEGNVELFSMPELFAFGPPSFDLSLIPIAFFIAIIVLSNAVASIVAANQVLDRKPKDKNAEINKGTMFSGVSQGLAGGFAAIANVPLATSTGFIALTGQKRKLPFIYATILIIFIAFFPPVISFISTIPGPIANAALMASFVQLVGLAVKNVSLEKLDSRIVTILGVAYLIGMGIMFLPTEVFSDLPSIVQNIMSNGLIVGTGLVIIIEQLWKTKDNFD
ncbi:purine/pyrimidine permease [Oceanobacillus sp. Castelsardo]|uniref:purine/pyrimidine permease n=1 Tax=Oceanobacillus sp. Castelsardo TaxID=1851204 RepID=UPI0008391C4D|nr:purine/pyrimidine permease [Oceanobacillus sp. Castelsardo]